jgi:hypothetical protein
MMYKKIHIGSMITMRLEELGMNCQQFSRRMKIEEDDCSRLLSQQEITTGTLLKISKILKYDFFRLYSMNLLLYAPPSMGLVNTSKKKVPGNPTVAAMPVFYKNTYTREVIQFILHEIGSGAKTPSGILSEYNIPKTTLYRWLKKYA